MSKLLSEQSFINQIITNNRTAYRENSGLGKWIYDNGVPLQTLGNYNDYYVDISSGIIYKKDDNISDADLTNPTTALTAAIADSEYSSSWIAAYAFDNDASLTNHSWLSDSTYPHWVGYDFGSGNEKEVVRLRVYSAGSNIASNYRLQGSNSLDASWNDKTWVTLSDEIQGLNSWVATDCTHIDSFRFYRIYATAGNTAYMAFWEVELFEDASYDWQVKYTPAASGQASEARSIAVTGESFGEVGDSIADISESYGKLSLSLARAAYSYAKI